MARSSRSGALLCIDVAGDRLQATWLPSGKDPAHAGDVVPAWATPVAVEGQLGWRVGRQAYQRRLVDADDALMAVPSLLGQAHDDHVDVSGLPLPWLGEQMAEHESFELPMAHLLAQATRRALGEPDPISPAEATPATGGTDDAQEAVGDDGDDPNDANAHTAAEAAADDADAASPEANDNENKEQPQAEGTASLPLEPSPDAPPSALERCEALLLLEGGASPAAQAALLQAAEIAGLPAPGVMLRDEAIAWATWRTAQIEAHAFAVRQQMAADATAAAQRQLAASAARDIVAPALGDAAPIEANDMSEGEDVASAALQARAASETTDDMESTSLSADAHTKRSPDDETTEPAAAPSQEPPSHEPGPPVPQAWTQLHIGYGAIEACKVEVGEHGPQVLHRARVTHAGMARLQGVAYGWAREAWRQAHGDTPLDAMAQRRLLDGALKGLRRLADAAAAEAAPLKEVRVDLPALCMGLAPGEDGDDDGRDAEPLSLSTSLSHKAALALLTPLTDAVLDVVAGCRSERAAAKGRKRARPPAADITTPGLLCTGDISAWPGLPEALAERLGTAAWLGAPSATAIAQAARTLLAGDASQAA